MNSVRQKTYCGCCASKTEVQWIMETCDASYAKYPSGVYDETDLLLMSQHCVELEVDRSSAVIGRNDLSDYDLRQGHL